METLQHTISPVTDSLSSQKSKSGIPDWEQDTEPIARLQVIDEHQKFT
jgi:hypothetical protein